MSASRRSRRRPERYRDDIVAGMCLAAKIGAGDADAETLQAYLAWHNARHPTQLLPITPELRDRIEILTGPIKYLDIDLDKAFEDTYKK